MGKRIKNLISSFSGMLPVEKLIPASGQRFIFPFWHSVSDTAQPHLSQIYHVPTIEQFKRDLDFLLKNYKPATIENVLRQTDQSKKRKEMLFFPSFDDGLKECHSVIAPILRKKGIQAAFFINPAFVDNQMLFHRHKASLILKAFDEGQLSNVVLREVESILKRNYPNKTLQHFLRQSVYSDHFLLDQIAAKIGIDFAHFLKQHQPYLTLSQIRQLQADGFLIGAHSADHREFFLSSEEEIRSQISTSMNFLNQEIKPVIKSFAFPFTDSKVADSVFEWANQFKIWDISFGTAGMKDESMPNHIQRIPMESDKTRTGKEIVRAEYIWYFLKSLAGKNKVSRS